MAIKAYQIKSSSSAHPPSVAFTDDAVDNLFLYEAPKDLRPTPATETAAPRTRTSEARVRIVWGEDIFEN